MHLSPSASEDCACTVGDTVSRLGRVLVRADMRRLPGAVGPPARSRTKSAAPKGGACRSREFVSKSEGSSLVLKDANPTRRLDGSFDAQRSCSTSLAQPDPWHLSGRAFCTKVPSSLPCVRLRTFLLKLRLCEWSCGALCGRTGRPNWRGLGCGMMRASGTAIFDRWHLSDQRHSFFSDESGGCVAAA